MVIFPEFCFFLGNNWKPYYLCSLCTTCVMYVTVVIAKITFWCSLYAINYYHTICKSFPPDLISECLSVNSIIATSILQSRNSEWGALHEQNGWL